MTSPDPTGDLDPASPEARHLWMAPKGPNRKGAVEAEANWRARQRPEIRPRLDVLVRTADDRWVPKVTTTGIVAGHDFPVVWVRTDDHEPVPWPEEDVRLPDDLP
jgi:hypothetical protein